MFRRIPGQLQRIILERPRVVLVACGIWALLAAWLAAGVEFRTSRAELAPAGDADQRRWDELLRDYSGSEAVIACVERAAGSERTDADLEAFADELAAELAADPAVASVFHRFDPAWVFERSLHLAPRDVLDRVESALDDHAETLGHLLAAENLADLDQRLHAAIVRGLGERAATPEAGSAAAEALAGLLAAQRRFLEDPSAALGPLDGADPWQAHLAARMPSFHNGYAKTHDGQTLFVLAIPHDPADDLASRRRLLERIRAGTDRALARAPGFRVAYTGQAAMNVEEMAAVRRDTWATSAVSIVGVTLLTLLVFRWRTHAFLVLAALGLGLVGSFGAVRLEYGYLNLITSAFISTLVGVGVAYGIHPVSEYELEGAHTVDPVAAVREAYRRTGMAVGTAGLTTAVAFLSILFMRFRGFGELGLVAGVGVLLCLLAALVFLPALLVVYGRWRQARDRRERPSVAIDRFWVEAAAERICRFPRSVTALGGLITLWLGVEAVGVGFDTNLLKLLPSDAESLRYQERMVLDSSLSPVFNLVVAGDLAELRAMHEAASREPAIGQFESALRFLPDNPARAAAVASRLRAELARLRLAEQATPLARIELLEALVRLEDVLASAGEAAFDAGLAGVYPALERAREEADRAAAIVRDAGDAQVEAWNDGQRRALSGLHRLRDRLEQVAALPPPSVDDLPPSIRQRFFTSSGRPLGFLYPAGSVFEPETLEAYVDASLRVSPQAIGFPFMFRKMSHRITDGFHRAVVIGAVLVLALLFADFRDTRNALLAALPLALGMLWTVGLMGLAGLSFNFANLVAVPLIIGVGIDNGVHVVHRIRLEGREGMHVVLRHTGRAILIATLTTMIGFGSLTLASHRGLASLGLVLLIGVGSCLVTSTIVLPNLLVVLGRVER